MDKLELTNTQQVSNFAIEDLFCIEKMDECKSAEDEAVVYYGGEEEACGDNICIKRKLSLEEEEDVAKQPPKKKGGDPTTLPPAGGKARRLRRKNDAKEKDWKEFGHLPRASISRKYASSSQLWKTSLLTTKLRMTKGGYTSRAYNFQDMPEIQSLEHATSLGFVVIKSQNLCVYNLIKILI